MSFKTQINPVETVKEYGRRPYVDPTARYVDQMKRVTDKAMYNQKLELQSELKKPYLTDDYQQMEYYYPQPFTAFYDPELIYPEFSGPAPSGLWKCLTIDPNPCSFASYYPSCTDEAWCLWYHHVECLQAAGATFEWEITGSYLPDSLRLVEPRDYKSVLYFQFDPGNVDSLGYATVRIKRKMIYGGVEVNSAYRDLTVACDPCTGATPMTFDDVNSDLIIAPEVPGNLYVNDGIGPYQWELLFATRKSLGAAETETGENTITGNAIDCGYDRVKVTDSCGTVVYAYVKSTNSAWNTCGQPCYVNCTGYTGVAYDYFCNDAFRILYTCHATNQCSGLYEGYQFSAGNCAYCAMIYHTDHPCLPDKHCSVTWQFAGC